MTMKTSNALATVMAALGVSPGFSSHKSNEYAVNPGNVWTKNGVTRNWLIRLSACFG